jgi:RNA polymerase sigma factor (TIGR02999 family)
MGDFTEVLARLRQGEAAPEALDGLFAAAYDDLKRLAHQRLRRNEPVTQLDTTALVHESYLRFVHAGKIDFADRTHFIGYAARVMRSVIVDFVRARAAERRGGDQLHVTLTPEVAENEVREVEVIRLDEALAALETLDPALVRIVEMRFFAGLSVDEVAGVLDKSPRTVARDWQKARLILSDAIRAP